MRYFEDFEEGQVFELGSRTVEREEMLEFARRYDPQPFHLDDEAAKRTPYGGVIASGWLTLAIMARMGVDRLMSDSAGLGAPGIDEVRWTAPVRAGDTLTGRATVLDAQPSKSDPRRGTVRFRIELERAAGEPVLRLVVPMFLRRRPQ